MPNSLPTVTQHQIKALARSYSSLLYSRKLREILESVFEGTDFSNYQKYDLHTYLNSFLLKNYRGEEIVKYLIAKKYLKKDVVGAFELKTGNSRADFVSINGVSRCYEIRTKLDNLSKLPKQANDYVSAFDYNILVLDAKHLQSALEILPVEYGICVIGEDSIRELRSAKRNVDINSRKQLEMLTHRELKKFFGNSFTSIDNILSCNSSSRINSTFKLALKARYNDRWQFVKSNQDKILPIDLQFFFSTKESPKLLYQQ